MQQDSAQQDLCCPVLRLLFQNCEQNQGFVQLLQYQPKESLLLVLAVDHW